MAQDIYVDRVTDSIAINNLVRVGLGVIEPSEDEDAPEKIEETVRLRIPIADFQYFVSDLREALLELMRQGYYGEEGKKYVEQMSILEGNKEQQ